MMEVINLSHQYRFGSQSFSNLSFSLRKGEMLCLYGKEESGKTSVLKTLCGLLPGKTGTIILDGKDITHSKPEERNLTLLHEDGGFFEGKSVYYNLVYPLRIRKEREEYVSEKVKEVSKLFDITSLLSKKVNKLTVNERIAVEFARLFIRKSNGYLLDDPFKNAINRDKVFRNYYPFIQKLAEESFVVYATSSKEEMIELDVNTVILRYGIVEQQGKILDCIDKPNTVFVYELLHNAEKNLGRIFVSTDKQLSLSVKDRVYPLIKEKLLNDIYVGQEVLVCSDNNTKCKIFDKNCERLIYFDEIN